MESYSTWEAVLVGIFGLAFIYWLSPGIKVTLEKSQRAKSDWMGLLIPLGFVIIFVVFLVSTVR